MDIIIKETNFQKINAKSLFSVLVMWLGACRWRKSDEKVTSFYGHQVWKNANLHRKKETPLSKFRRQIFFYVSKNFNIVRIYKECQNTFFIELPFPKWVTFLIVTIVKYNQHLRTLGEHFEGHMKSYMLMTTKLGVFFVSMNSNFVITLLHTKLIFFF